MSMLQAFERLLHPKRAAREDRSTRSEREGTREAAAGPAARCKACGYLGDDVYCPTCLADTMQRIPRRRKR
jgi:hypothetical protein